MDKVIDDYIDLGVQRGMKQGMDRGRKEERALLIRSLCKKKSPEEIADLLEIPVEEILKIIKE